MRSLKLPSKILQPHYGKFASNLKKRLRPSEKFSLAGKKNMLLNRIWRKISITVAYKANFKSREKVHRKLIFNEFLSFYSP